MTRKSAATSFGCGGRFAVRRQCAARCPDRPADGSTRPSRRYVPRAPLVGYRTCNVESCQIHQGQYTSAGRPGASQCRGCNDRVTVAAWWATFPTECDYGMRDFTDLQPCKKPASEVRTNGGVMALRHTHRIAMTAAVAAMALLLGACGSSSSGNKNTNPAGAGTTPATTGASSAPAPKSLKVGLAYDVGGRGDKSFNDLAAAGLEKAKSDLSIQTKELSAVQGENDQQKADRLTLLASSGYNPIVAVGFAYATALGKVAPKFPKVQLRDRRRQQHQGAERRGPGVQRERELLPGRRCRGAGHQDEERRLHRRRADPADPEVPGGLPGAASRRSNPAIKVQVAYISQAPDFSGFNDPAKGKVIAEGSTTTALTSSTTLPAARAVACSRRPRRRTSSPSASTPTSTRRHRRTRSR